MVYILFFFLGWGITSTVINGSIFDKIRNYDFEDSRFRSKKFKDTLIEYTPKVVDLHRQEAIEHQKAVEETLSKTSNPVGSLIDKPLSDETN